MPDRERPPVFLLAFANDRRAGGRHLPRLSEEHDRIRGHLQRAKDKGLCEFVMHPFAKTDALFADFQRYGDRIALFHFGGHAGDFQLLMESANGAPTPAHAEGLAELLGYHRGLRLVFLNGCSTQRQVEALQRAGVPAVIATSEAVGDAVAMELAAHFYAGLAAGDNLKAAYDKAVAAVKTVHGGGGAQVRDMVQPEAAAYVDRWPWALDFREGAERIGSWSLPAAVGDPLFGLPPLPERDMPETPYRHLAWFREEDAEVFFGRGREIRDFYEQITAPSGEPILLFHGESGVGKSSLLAAGLLPRLKGSHEVRYARRDRERGLAGTLADVLEADQAGIAAAWHTREKTTNRPLVVILDQVEETYTRPGGDDELDAFLDVLSDVFADRECRPRGRLVLAFRKEWLADLETLLRERLLPRSKVPLRRLDRAGIIEVVDGPARTERLRRRYGLSVEPRLAEVIADDLLEDREAPVAPTLQILLTKLWHRATRTDPEALAFTIDLYQQLKREGLLLDDFLTEQLDALRGWNAEAVDTGLALSVLAYHTTPLGTAESRTRAEVEDAYAHRSDLLPALLQQSQDRYLLMGEHWREDGGEGTETTRLAHDTLAPLVRQRFEGSDRPGQRAERIMESRAVDWKDGNEGAVLDEADLTTAEDGQLGMRQWGDAERRLIAASRKARSRRNRARRRQRWAAVGAVAAIIALGVFAWISRGNALRQAYISTAQKLAMAAPDQRGRDEFDSDRRMMLLAVQAASFNDQYEGPMFGSIDRLLRDMVRTSTDATVHDSLDYTRDYIPFLSVAFSPDGRTLASAGLERAIRLWDPADPTAEPDTLSGHVGPVRSVAFSPDGRTLASAGQDGTVRLWDPADPTAEPDTLSGHVGPVRSVAFSPDGRTLASASDGTIRLWDLADPTAEPDTLSGHVGPVRSVAFSPDGRTLASAGQDGTVRLWDPADPTAEPDTLSGHVGPVRSVAFSPDGRTLASASDGTIRLWDLADPTAEPDTLSGHYGSVLSVAFSPDGRTLASAGQERAIRLWDPADPTADPIVLTGHPNWVFSVAFSPDGRTLASASDGTVRLWLVAHDDLVEAICERLDRNLTRAEWDTFIGPELPYERTCPTLPAEPILPASSPGSS